jgi:hypothetical protein
VLLVVRVLLVNVAELSFKTIVPEASGIVIVRVVAAVIPDSSNCINFVGVALSPKLVRESIKLPLNHLPRLAEYWSNSPTSGLLLQLG